MKFLLLVFFFTFVSANSVDKDSSKCAFCKKTIATVFEMLQNEENQQNIIDKLEKGCKQLETELPFLAEPCYDLLENVVKPQLGEAVENFPTPEEACHIINYC
ncbi:unnamed protein product [Lepeophtheirus salmonis]|uniref:(salmon louse) hypothetical protein n=2 Tax=Lepeophtheirus salmonis TaxID=72036 RepID=A0A7R8D748_LEPSM|nr:unnamed protein product [Lepeophtheirus salmonis]CAF3045319.1 unnamed protein product [Lepeophtheirus salmonis]